MASTHCFVYLNMDNTMFLDEDRTVPLHAPLYRSVEDLTTFYMDAELTRRVEFVQPGQLQSVADESDCATSSPTVSALPTNDCFVKEHTLFLIEHMRQHIMDDGDLPKNLTELNARLRKAKANKKLLWIEAAASLTKKFLQSFSPEKVARKWVTLVDAYKRIKDNQKSTGRGTIRFQFFKEMDELLGEQHDVSYPVIACGDGVEVTRPDAVGRGTRSPFTPPTSAETPVQPLSPLPPAAPTSRKRRRSDDVLEFLRTSEDNTQRRHDESMEKLQSAQDDFKSLMTQLIQKI